MSDWEDGTYLWKVSIKKEIVEVGPYMIIPDANEAHDKGLRAENKLMSISLKIYF